MFPYAEEQFTPDEEAILRRYVTNLDLPVFALVNLPEVVKGALFARYSRSPKSLRRLFLDEFVGDLDISGDASVDATVGLERAESLYEKVFVEYGDDSVAQLGGVHLACEQSSNLLSKVLEWGRLMSYLEQSTRYIAYNNRLESGHYRYFRPPEVLESPIGARYVGDMDRVFDTYGELLAHHAVLGGRATLPPTSRGQRLHLPPSHPGEVPRCAARPPPGRFPVQHRALRHRPVLRAAAAAHARPPAARGAHLRRHDVDRTAQSDPFVLATGGRGRAGRGVDGVPGLHTRRNRARVVRPPLARPGPITRRRRRIVTDSVPPAEVTLLDFDPDGEEKVLIAACFSHLECSERQAAERVRQLSHEERVALLAAYVGDRRNRRHRPGRAFERTDYRFELVTDYGAFRDLQRHRMLTIEWQRLGISLGYDMPGLVADAGLGEGYADAIGRAEDLYRALQPDFPEQAGYAVALAHRIRYVMQCNAREAMHLIELRSGAQGHPAYRRVAQQMHRAIAEVAGHRAVADAMTFVDHGSTDLERLDSERRAERRRSEKSSTH